MGGTGGDGGTLYVLVPNLNDFDPKSITAYVDAGKGGPGGVGGPGGEGGGGGPGGTPQLPWCKGDGLRGEQGPPGAEGKDGIAGNDGKGGAVFLGALDPRMLKALLKETK